MVEMRTNPDKKPSVPQFFLLSIAEVARLLHTDVERGLSQSAIPELQVEYGRNVLETGGGTSALSILAGQAFNAMVLILIMAMAVSFGIRSWIEGGVISAVILLNIVVGFLQEYSSAKTMDSLRSLASPSANLVRDGRTVVVPSAQVVPGDLVELKTGDVVPADIRLVDSMNFETDEALLTGESLPVDKDHEATWHEKQSGDPWDPRDVAIGDRVTMAFSSTTVTKGRALGIVVATGMKTEIGAIAESLSRTGVSKRTAEANEDGHVPFYRYIAMYVLKVADSIGSFLGLTVGTPLHRKLSQLAILLFFIAVIFAVVVFAANSFSTADEIVIYAVATGLSMIPASLVVCI